MVALGSLFIRLMVGSTGKPAMNAKEKGSPWVINTSHVGFVGRLKRLRGGNVAGVYSRHILYRNPPYTKNIC